MAASWSELGRVNIWNLTEQLQAVDNPEILKAYNNQNKTNSIKPIYTFSGHQKEGFALDWSPTMPGVNFVCNIFCSLHYVSDKHYYIFVQARGSQTIFSHISLS